MPVSVRAAGCVGWLCPCYVSNQVATETDGASPVVCCICSALLYVPYLNMITWISGCQLRAKFRATNNIDGGCFDEFFCGGCCHIFNLCQMARHLDANSSGVESMER